MRGVRERSTCQLQRISGRLNNGRRRQFFIERATSRSSFIVRRSEWRLMLCSLLPVAQLIRAATALKAQGCKATSARSVHSMLRIRNAEEGRFLGESPALDSFSNFHLIFPFFLSMLNNLFVLFFASTNKPFMLSNLEIQLKISRCR